MSKSKDVTGCFILAWNLLLTWPLWAAFIVGVLRTIEPPTWLIVVSCVYVAAQFVGLLLATCMKFAEIQE